MTPQQQYIAEMTERCRTEWFKEHRAKVLTVIGGEPILIDWSKLGTWNYGCRFIIHRRWLCVVGDIGEAVFEWSNDITSEFLLQINFDYFLDKCQAAPTGVKFQQWDPRVAYQAKENYIAEDHNSRADDVAFKILSDLGKNVGKEDYDFAARSLYEKTSDAELASMISEFGLVPSAQAIGMFVGLQMALTQLKEAKT